jgi:hypothetical protein
MKLHSMLVLILLLCFKVSFAQQHIFNGRGQISFSAGAPLELIRGTSSEMVGSIDLVSGKLLFEVPIASFQFINSLMLERFNDKYMESGRYAKASFKGILLNFSQATAQEVQAEGLLTVHGVTKKRTIKGTLTNNGDHFILQSAFFVSTKDHRIESPKLTNAYMADNISVDMRMILYPADPTLKTVTLNQKGKAK